MMPRRGQSAEIVPCEFLETVLDLSRTGIP
jgi:hypothetical protein